MNYKDQIYKREKELADAWAKACDALDELRKENKVLLDEIEKLKRELVERRESNARI